jgi:hypothetical protein
MRISFRMEGGLAHVPGLSEPVSIDTDELPAEEASELERLIEAARFFELPATSALPRGAADYRKYTITVATPARSHTAHLTDPIDDLHVQELVSHLSRLRAKNIEARLAARRRDTS